MGRKREQKENGQRWPWSTSPVHLVDLASSFSSILPNVSCDLAKILVHDLAVLGRFRAGGVDMATDGEQAAHRPKQTSASWNRLSVGQATVQGLRGDWGLGGLSISGVCLNRCIYQIIICI